MFKHYNYMVDNLKQKWEKIIIEIILENGIDFLSRNKSDATRIRNVNVNGFIK